MTKKKQSGLGKGLDSLIPDYYDENFNSNNQLSLEDMLKDDEVDIMAEEPETSKDEDIVDETPQEEDVVDVSQDEEEDIVEEQPQEIEDTVDDEVSPEPQEEIELSEKELSNIQEVKDIVDKNPRITLWSAKSSAVFRYLRKTEPEFSISKEASILIEEAVREKYPDIWKLFDGI